MAKCYTLVPKLFYKKPSETKSGRYVEYGAYFQFLVYAPDMNLLMVADGVVFA